MDTPPARVAFSMISISSFPKRNLEVKAAERQLEAIERIVLQNILCCLGPVAKAPLKEGQYIQRKIVPIIAMVFAEYPPFKFLLLEALIG